MRFCSTPPLIRTLKCGMLLAVALLSVSCAGNNVPAPASSSFFESAAVGAAAGLVSRETGTAAWYANAAHNGKTAGSAVFTPSGFSAAHRTLPLGSAIRVTNLENSKSILVQVRGRGPFFAGRIIDLSYEAAIELGFAPQGLARVMIEYPDQAVGASLYTIHAAQYAEVENAKLLKERLSAKYETIAIIPVSTEIGIFYHVEIGSYATEEKAELIAGKLTLEGLEPVVIRKDR